MAKLIRQYPICLFPVPKGNINALIISCLAYFILAVLLHSNSNDDTTTTAFVETPLMSAYLLAFTISDLRNISNAPGHFPHRFFVQPKDLDAAEYGLAHGEIILRTLQNYLQVNYSLPKMDQVVVPDMIYWGIKIYRNKNTMKLQRNSTLASFLAMENWGMVTFQDDHLLWNEERHTSWRQMLVIYTISHEFGHQWFGNLVSPLNWAHVWLNEGFATLFGHIGNELVKFRIHSDDI